MDRELTKAGKFLSFLVNRRLRVKDFKTDESLYDYMVKEELGWVVYDDSNKYEILFRYKDTEEFFCLNDDIILYWIYSSHNFK